MKGLIYKDLIYISQQWKAYLLCVVLWGALSVMQKSAGFFGGMLSVYVIIIILYTFTCDEKSGWDKYALTLPVSRAEIVFSKYLFALILTVACFVIGILFSIALGGRLEEIALTQCCLLTFALFLQALQLPLIFKFGSEKSRFILAIVFVMPVLFVYLFIQAGFSLPDFEILMTMIYLAPVICLGLLALSIFVSVQIVKGKEY